MLSIIVFAYLKPLNAPAIAQNPSNSEPDLAKIETNKNFERDNKLQTNTNELLALFDNMPHVSVYIKDEPIIKSGSNTERGVAYTNCTDNNNPTIIVKKSFYEKANQKQLINILKHELTHSWLCRQQMMFGHDEMFRKKFKQVGGFGN